MCPKKVETSHFLSKEQEEVWPHLFTSSVHLLYLLNFIVFYLYLHSIMFQKERWSNNIAVKCKAGGKKLLKRIF